MHMKKSKDNICKFVSAGSQMHTLTANFVLETCNENIRHIKMSRNCAMYLVVSGTGTLCTEHAEKELRPGTLFFSLTGSACSIVNKQDLNYMYISFNGERTHELFERFKVSPFNCIFYEHEALICFWQSSLEKANSENIDLISESVLLYSFSALSQSCTTKDETLLNDILKFIEDNFKDCDLSLNSTADALGYNAKYISRVFKNGMGVTFTAHLKTIRMQHAIFLMEQGITAVKNVALLSGYTDPFYFSNVFKNTFGISPKEFLAKKKIDAKENIK